MPDDEPARDHRPDESTPEHKACAAPKGRPVLLDDAGVIQPSADQRADNACDDKVRNSLGFLRVTAPQQLLLRDDLRDHEREQHGDTKARDLERTDVEYEWVVDYLHD